MQERLKILNLHTQADGCSYVRHKIPFEALRERNHFVQMKFPLHRMDFQFAVLSRQFAQDLIVTLFKMKAAGMKLVYDTDDLLFEIEPENPYFSHASTIQAVKLSKACMPLVDLVTCTTARLAEELKAYTKAPIHVLPNCVQPNDWKERPRAKRDTVRIGYAGSIAHLKELLFLIPIIKELQKKHRIEFHILGIFHSLAVLKSDCELKAGNPLWQKLGRKVLHELERMEYVHHEFVPISQYPAQLAALDLDIGLCPLFQSRFNDCKSNVKFLEYSMAGTAPLCSDSIPYKDCPYAVPMEAKLWKQTIERMILDEAYRNVHAMQAKYFTLENHDIRLNAHRWEEVYLGALQKRPTILEAQEIGQR